jgi:glycosyltransferase involved in cell wall biosynthesis
MKAVQEYRKEAQGVQKSLGELVDAIIVHSSLQEFELLNQGVSYNKLFRIPHGTFINPYVSSDRYHLLDELGLRADNRKLLIVPGFLRRNKGPDLILEAFRVLERKCNNGMKLVVWGEAQGSDNLRFVTQLFGKHRFREDNVIFARGFLEREAMLKLLASMDLVVLPYVEPPHCYSVSGAFHMTIGSFKPVVCTRVPKLIECYEIAPSLVVTPNNPDLLAAKIHDVLTRIEVYQEDLRALNEYARKTSWQNVARMHVRLYRSLIESPRQ